MLFSYCFTNIKLGVHDGGGKQLFKQNLYPNRLLVHGNI